MSTAVERGTTTNSDKVKARTTSLRRVHLVGRTSDPVGAVAGDIWYRSDTDAYRVMTGAGVKTITVS